MKAFLRTYKERMNESWEAKAFGITLPIYAVLMIALFIFVPLRGDSPEVVELKFIALIPNLIITIWFIISYVLLINRQIKDKEEELKQAIWRDSKKSF